MNPLALPLLVLTFGLVVPALGQCVSVPTEMHISPTLVQLGVETEVAITYSESAHVEEGVLVEGRPIRGHLPTFEGAGVSVVRFRITDPGCSPAAESCQTVGMPELAFEWRVAIMPTHIGSIVVSGIDEAGNTHRDTVRVVEELPPPLQESEGPLETILRYVEQFLEWLRCAILGECRGQTYPMEP